MPRYYFDVRQGSRFSADHLGDELPNLEAAEREAAEVAVAIARDRLPAGDDRTISIGVRDEDGPVITVNLTMTIERAKSFA